MEVSNVTRLLGLNVSKDLNFKEHILSGEKALLGSVNKKLGALKLIGRKLTKESRLRLANGLIISRFCYLIQIWGNTSPELIRKLQCAQNRAARFVLICKLTFETSGPSGPPITHIKLGTYKKYIVTKKNDKTKILL